MKSNLFVVIAALSTLLVGCRTSTVTETSRSAVEQLLLSTAVDRSLEQLDPNHITDKKVFVEVKNLETVDKGYVIGKVRQELGENKAIVVEDRKAADVILEVYSGALATDKSTFMLGVPEIPIPLGVDTILPEFPFIKKVGLSGVSKLAIHAKTSEDKYIFSTESMYGNSYYNHWTILFLGFATTDIPEMK